MRNIVNTHLAELVQLICLPLVSQSPEFEVRIIFLEAQIPLGSGSFCHLLYLRQYIWDQNKIQWLCSSSRLLKSTRNSFQKNSWHESLGEKSSVWLTFLKNKFWFWWLQAKYQYWGHDEFCLNQHSENKWNKNTNILQNGNVNLLTLTYIMISYHLYIFIWKYTLPFKSLRPVGFFFKLER